MIWETGVAHAASRFCATFEKKAEDVTVIALAGRRVDSPDAKVPGFPLGNVETVRMRTRDVLIEKRAVAVVASAACGADLIALSEAGQLGLRRRVVLPFERKRFRETSVTDRPGEWGALYDRVLDAVAAVGDLVVLLNGEGEEAYSVANRAILDETVELARALHKPAIAVLIWDGVSRGDQDLTEEFGAEARKRELPVTEILTIG
jgi:hypothetical protein